MLSGCYKKADVLTVDGYPVYPGLYLYFQLQAINEATQKFSNQYSGKELYNQTIDDVPVRDWIYNRTVEYAKEFVFIEHTFERLELDAEMISLEMSYYGSNIQSDWSSSSFFYLRNGVGFATYYKVYENYLKSNQVFTALFVEEDGEEAVPEKEIIDYFNRNYTYIDYVRIFNYGDDLKTYSDEILEELRTTIEEMKSIAVDTVKEAGIVFEDPDNVGLMAAYDYYCEKYGLSEQDKEEKRSSMFSSNTVVKSDSTAFDEDMIIELFASKNEVFTVYEAKDAFYLFCRRSMLDNDSEKWKDYRTSIVTELRSKVYTEYISENSVDLPFSQNSGARKYYSIDKAYT